MAAGRALREPGRRAHPARAENPLLSLGFIVAGIHWSFHHAALARPRRIGGTVVFLNLMLLLLVTFMPFPTILMGEYPFTALPLAIRGTYLIATNLIGFVSIAHPHWRPDLPHPGIADNL